MKFQRIIFKTSRKSYFTAIHNPISVLFHSYQTVLERNFFKFTSSKALKKVFPRCRGVQRKKAERIWLFFFLMRGKPLSRLFLFFFGFPNIKKEKEIFCVIKFLNSIKNVAEIVRRKVITCSLEVAGKISRRFEWRHIGSVFKMKLEIFFNPSRYRFF